MEQLAQYDNIFKQPDWPIRMRPVWGKYFFEANTTEEDRAIKPMWVTHVIKLLREDKVYIADSGENDDSLRKPITRIAVHNTHSSAHENGLSSAEYLEYVNALQLIRLYSYYYSKPDFDEYGKPVYSGHYYQGKQTFICYHWIIFEDGSAEKINQDQSLVWHAAGANNDSISICFVGNFSDGSRPSKAQLERGRSLIQEYNKKYGELSIFGHGEVTKGADCPGTTFLEEDGWKEQLS
jgi:hypothetical protein